MLVIQTIFESSMVESTTFSLKTDFQRNRRSMLSLIKSLTKGLAEARMYASMTPEERYLSKSSDLVDLENRQKELMYGRRKPSTFFVGH